MNKHLTVLMFNHSSNKDTLTETHCYSLTKTLTLQLLLYLTIGNLCWKWFPDSMLNWPFSYSALFNVYTLRTVCECRWQPTLNHEKQSCSGDKDWLIWLHKPLVHKAHVYHILTVSPCCLVFQFNTVFSQISTRSKCFMLCSSTTLTLLSIRFCFWLPALSLSAFASLCCPRQSKLLLLSHMHLSKQHR